MSDWDSRAYLKFKEQRTQPAVDLAMRVRKYSPQSIADIGCGPGNSTAVLQEVFPDAGIIGIDSSPNMIERARSEHPDLRFEVCDAQSLEGRYDLLFSNACLQWIPGHDTLIPALMEKLNLGGVLAVQMPRNEEEPLFRLIDELAGEPEWGFADAPPVQNKTLAPEEYFDILSGCASSFEVWETRYFHRLPDHRALVEWVKSTRLRPYLSYLGEERGAAFEEALAERAKPLYPIRKGGGVLLGFRRLFFTAVNFG